MPPQTLERRRDPRTNASVAIRLFYHDTPFHNDSANLTPAHLVDLSSSGAGLVTSNKNSPAIGQYIDLIFEKDAAVALPSKQIRRQTAIVVNVGRHDPEVARIGVRFMEGGDSDCELIDPVDLLSDHRKGFPIADPLRKWETARHFHMTSGMKPATWRTKRSPAVMPVGESRQPSAISFNP